MERKRFDPDAKTKEALRGLLAQLGRALHASFDQALTPNYVEDEWEKLADKFIAFLEVDD